MKRLFGLSVIVTARMCKPSVARFQQGMASLFHKERSPSVDKGRSLLPDMRQLIVDLKAEHPSFRPHEIATICFLHFSRKPSDHTVKRVLADGPKPSITIRRYPSYAQITDGYERRRAIVDLHSEGWSITTISAYLQTPRHRVYEVLKRWVQEGHAGLDDKPSTPHQPARKAMIHESRGRSELSVPTTGKPLFTTERRHNQNAHPSLTHLFVSSTRYDD